MSGRLRSGPVPVVYDTDIGDNVDDALALVLALASPEIALTAVSVEATGHPEVARRLLDAAGRSEVPVTVAPPLGDGVHLVATGPFTNVADALRADPAMAARLDGITVMGGMVDAGRFPPYWRERRRGGPQLDTNSQADPDAALTVALSGARLTWVPIEVTLHTQLTRDGLRRLEQARSQVGAMLAAMVRDWSERGFRHRTHGQPDAVANMHDALAMASLLPEAPSWLTLEPATLAYAVDAGGTFTTTAVAATHGHNGDNGNAGHSARVATRVDAAAFERFYLDCVLAAFG